ncbi:MAG: hypothetical protein JWR38_5517 [Mucilaginibacter sp.]|nr:hypothetical protein [Mucilaginibacter sp.]
MAQMFQVSLQAAAPEDHHHFKTDKALNERPGVEIPGRFFIRYNVI